MVTSSLPERIVLDAAPGDVLISHHAIPYPGGILIGFRKWHKVFEPYVDFEAIQNLLEFLEHVVLCERLIVPIPRYSRQSKKLIDGKRTWMNFAAFGNMGDLDYTTERLAGRLEAAGVLWHAEIDVGEPSADELVTSLMPRSPWMRSRFAHYLEVETIGQQVPNKVAAAQAYMAARIGAPLHTAEAARLVGAPYILSPYEGKELAGYDRETLRVRRSVTQRLLDHLNRGARREIEKLSDLGSTTVFPETPIARLILDAASSVDGLVDAAIALRAKFADFRQEMNQLESELAGESQSPSLRLKRLRELENLASSLWKQEKTDLRTNALTLSETLFAIPEIVAAPSTNSIKNLVTNLLALPVERLIAVYKRRKVRLLIKAKRNFLRRSNDATAKLAQILHVPEEVAFKSRTLDKPLLTKRYVSSNPDFAESYYGNQLIRVGLLLFPMLKRRLEVAPTDL